MSETYEQLRDSATGPPGEAWQRADREEANLRTLYNTLKEDPRYTEEHKAEKAWGAYEAAKEKIAADKAKAREGLEKQARSGERFSIPMPQGEHVLTADPQKLLLSQNEASRVVRKLERLENRSGPGQFKPTPAEVLKSEYQRGLEVGGIQGGAVCRGVLSAADERGVDQSTLVNDFRNERHHKALSDAERASMLTQLIGKQIPEPPFKRPVDRTSGPGKLFIPRDRPLQVKQRRAPWK
jgi:hypothetical protein